MKNVECDELTVVHDKPGSSHSILYEVLRSVTEGAARGWTYALRSDGQFTLSPPRMLSRPGASPESL